MKKNLHLGFIIICTLVLISNAFLLLNSKKGGRILHDISMDITPGAIAMVEMAHLSSEIGYYFFRCAASAGCNADSHQQLQTDIQLLRDQGGIHLAHERHIGVEEKKAAERLVEKIKVICDFVEEFYEGNAENKERGIQAQDLEAIQQSIKDLTMILHLHKEVHLGELQAAQQLILSKKSTLNVVIAGSSLILLMIIIFIWWSTLKMYNQFTLEQEIQRKQIEQDFIEKKQIEEKLHQAQRLESIGLMAGGVAHDLNNILSGVVGYAELLLFDLPKESKLRSPIESILDSGTRAATVVADLLTVAKGVASIRDQENLNSLAQEYFVSPEFNTLQSFHLKVSYEQDFMAAHSFILCSPVHVKKCLMNLVTNGSEAIDGKGIVSVSTENRFIEEAEAVQCDIKAGEYVVLCVCDTGSGVADQELQRIFEPFYTKKVLGRSGTGLGLTVVWNTMKDHDGIVLVESDGAGTCFNLLFPVSGEKVVTETDSDDIECLIGQGESILLVDDEPHLRDIGCQMLETIGYDVTSVCSGELAIQFVQENKVDLLVLDMLMEPGMSGRQTYEEILKLYPGQKAIIASGFSESDDVKAALKCGVGKFVKKPYSITKLGQAVREVLKSNGESLQ